MRELSPSLPVHPGCGCRICAPDDEVLDAEDADCIDTVGRAGWQVLCIAGGEDDEPAFAYTVGLGHRVGHPELAMSGQRVEVMHSVLNTVAARVVAGYALRPGDPVEGALGNVPLTVDVVSDAGLAELGLWSCWFHRRPVDVLQLVWPGTSGIFGWQPGADPALEDLQPPAWRVPSPRVGAFAVDPPWPMPVPPDKRVLVCDHIRERGAPILLVARQANDDGTEDWTFHCGLPHRDDLSDVHMEHVAHVVRSAPSVRELADLGLEEVATRADAHLPWLRQAIADFDDA